MNVSQILSQVWWKVHLKKNKNFFCYLKIIKNTQQRIDSMLRREARLKFGKPGNGSGKGLAKHRGLWIYTRVYSGQQTLETAQTVFQLLTSRSSLG